MLRFFAVLGFLIITTLANTACANNTPFAQQQNVQQFIQTMVQKHHFQKKQLESLFAQVKFVPQVMKHMSKPLEKEPWKNYQLLFVNKWLITNGVKFWNEYADTLKRAEKMYGVPPGIIVATIGIETKYGKHKGGFRVIDALSNIAFSDSSRAKYFRTELEQFLLLTRENHLDPLKVTGSYAGAIGQPQFMPSSYRTYAVDFSHSGKIDLMNDEIDVIGSIANYYEKHGWKKSQPVVTSASMLEGDYNNFIAHEDPTKAYTFEQFAKFGIFPKEKVEDMDLRVKLIALQSTAYTKEYWFAFHNFDVIKRYNSSDLYALAVYQLSKYITTLRQKEHKSHDAA